MIGNDGWKCATVGCHDGAGAVPPLIPPNDPAAALTALKGYSMKGRPEKRYIATSGNPDDSTISCNLGGACNPIMPIGDAKQLTGDERCKLDAWLKCGAPNN
jgi:hypothetical protein